MKQYGNEHQYFLLDIVWAPFLKRMSLGWSIQHFTSENPLEELNTWVNTYSMQLQGKYLTNIGWVPELYEAAAEQVVKLYVKNTIMLLSPSACATSFRTIFARTHSGHRTTSGFQVSVSRCFSIHTFDTDTSANDPKSLMVTGQLVV